MKTYRIRLYAPRRAEPLALDAVLADDARALELARERLGDDDDFELVEVWHAGRLLYRQTAAR